MQAEKPLKKEWITKKPYLIRESVPEERDERGELVPGLADDEAVLERGRRRVQLVLGGGGGLLLLHGDEHWVAEAGPAKLSKTLSCRLQ